MLQNRKLQILILALFIGGVWWMKKSDDSALAVTKTLEAKAPVAAVQAANSEQAPMVPMKNETPTFVRENSPLAVQVQSIADSFSNPDQELSPELLDVSKITDQGRMQLRAAVTNQNLAGTTRRASLFLLKRMGPAAMQELGEIAATPLPQFPPSKDPHSVSALSKDFEVGLRITTLEALDQMTANGKEVLPLLQKALAAQTDKDLIFLTRIAISGIHAGKPGKLSRAMDAMINEKSL